MGRKHIICFGLIYPNRKLEDLKVLKRSPDPLNNVIKGQGQLRLIIQKYYVLPYMGMAAILVMWPEQFVQILAKDIVRNLHLKNKFNWPSQWALRKLCFDIFVWIQYERPWLKGQRSTLSWPLELIYSHYLIRLNLSSENNDFGFNSFQNINFFKKKSHLNALGSKVDLDVM